MASDPHDAELISAAIDIMARAYAPYSGYHVGAAVRADNGKVYVGVNVENAAYPQGNCAETGAIAAMIADGAKRIDAVAVAGREGETVVPCGGCRQRLSEFAPPSVPVYACDRNGLVDTFSLAELLPFAFGPDHLGDTDETDM